MRTLAAMPIDDEPPRDEAARCIADWPEVVARLLAAHIADRHGCCRACAGATGVAPPWPCRLAALARSADELAAGSPSAIKAEVWPTEIH